LNPTRFLIILTLLAGFGCQSNGPIAPGGADSPPAWVSTVGIVSVVPGESAVTVYWGEVIDFQDPPVKYLVYKDVDDNPFDQTPVIRDTNEPYTITNLAIGTEYRLGVRCRDSAKPPHVDDNDKVISARTASARTWGGSSDDHGYSVAVDGSGNVYVTGAFAGTVDFDPGTGVDIHDGGGAFLSKFDSSGNFLWAKTWGGSEFDSGNGVAVDGSGNVYVTGDFSGTWVDFDPGPGVDSYSSYGLDIFLSKFDSSGTFVWVSTGGWSYEEWAYGVAVDGSGNAYVTGTYTGTVNDLYPHIFLNKYDSSGTFAGAHTWGSWKQGGGVGHGVAVDGSGNVYVTGEFEGTVDFNPDPIAVDYHSSEQGSGVFLGKLDPFGAFVWARTWGGNDWNGGSAVAVDGPGSVYVTGFFSGASVDFDPDPTAVDLHSSNGWFDVFLSKFDSSGTFEWAHTWGGSDFYRDSGNGVAVDGPGNVYVTGDFLGASVDFNPDPTEIDVHSSNGGYDAFLVKFMPDGSW